MKWTVRILQVLVGIGFLLSGFMKLSGDPTQVAAFNEIYGYGTGFMYVVGAIELISAVGLLLGVWKQKLIPVFSVALVIVMAGAVVTHLQAGQGFGMAFVPFVFLVLCLLVFLGQRKLAAKAVQ
ncbi:DoxX family protein [Paenibacillus sp. y28]|uniref:DoxX family protein n=1 Tax=Paenibacillus sp. y28 TaxID=3129110 RepID=UPI003015E1C7